MCTPVGNNYYTPATPFQSECDSLRFAFEQFYQCGEEFQNQFLNNFLNIIEKCDTDVHFYVIETYLPCCIAQLSNEQFYEFCKTPYFQNIIQNSSNDTPIVGAFIYKIQSLTSLQQVQLFNITSPDHQISCHILENIFTRLEKTSSTAEYALDLFNQMDGPLDLTKTEVIRLIFKACIGLLEDGPFCQICLHNFFEPLWIDELGLKDEFILKFKSLLSHDSLEHSIEAIQRVAVKFFNEEAQAVIERIELSKQAQLLLVFR